MCWATASSWLTSRGFGGEVAPPTHRFYSGGEQDLRGFDTRSVGPYVFIPNKIEFTLTNPDGTAVPLNPANPALGNVVIPLPIYRMVSIGGDTQLMTNLEYRIPIVNQVTFAFFTDFGMTSTLRAGPVAAEHGRSIADQRRTVWVPDYRQWSLLRRQFGQVPEVSVDRSRHQLCAAHVERR